MSFHAVIFDLDGTLLDTLQGIADSANGALTRYGFPTHGLDAYRYFVGDGVKALFERALPTDQRNENNIRDCVATFRENYKQNWSSTCRPYDGIPELLSALAAKSVKMAVLSNKPDDFTKNFVDEFLPDWEFEMVLGEREGIPRKPDPSAAHEIAENLGITPDRFLYLGDTAVDMITATSAGMFPVGALWGFRPRAELLEHGAAAVIETPLGLLDYLGDSG